jgi:hypothetical protein
MGGKSQRRVDPYRQRADETHLQWRARVAALDDRKASAKQPPVTPEAARHGNYQEGYTEIDGQRRAVLINRGGSTIQRWLNTPPCSILGDSERAAIRYCQMLWARLDYKSPAVVIVDNGRDGMAEHEALAELAAIKIRFPSKLWDFFENVCRFEHPAKDRHDKVRVGFVAGMVALWRGM